MRIFSRLNLDALSPEPPPLFGGVGRYLERIGARIGGAVLSSLRFPIKERTRRGGNKMLAPDRAKKPKEKRSPVRFGIVRNREIETDGSFLKGFSVGHAFQAVSGRNEVDSVLAGIG
jgi:hypothetical protein